MSEEEVKSFKNNTLSLKYLLESAKKDPKHFIINMIDVGLSNDIPILIPLVTNNVYDYYFAAEKYYRSTGNKKGGIEIQNLFVQHASINKMIEEGKRNHILFLQQMLKNGKQNQIPLLAQLTASCDDDYYHSAKEYYRATNDKVGVKRILYSYSIWENDYLIDRFEREITTL